MSSKKEDLSDDQKKSVKSAIAVLYPGEKDARVFDAVYKYLQNEKQNWTATTEEEYKTVVRKYYEIALLSSHKKSNLYLWMLGGVGVASALGVGYWYKTYASKKVRPQI